MDDSRYSRGLKHLGDLAGNLPPALMAALQDISPDLARLTVEFGYGDVYSRPGLSPRYRQLATVAMLATLGNARPQLKFHIEGALNIGCAASEIIETLIHIVPYAGFPAAINGIECAREVFEQRQLPPLAHPVDSQAARDDGHRYREGWAALTAIDGEAGTRVVDSLKMIAPDLGRFVVEFAFGDIYTRPGLDLLTREVATVAALSAMGTATPQLKVHIHGLLNVGGTPTLLVETLIHTAVYAGFPAAINAMLAAKEVLIERAERIPG